MTTADLPAEKVAALAEVLRWVKIGPFGPHALDIIKAGGVTHLNSSERADFAEALAPLIAGWLGEARAKALRIVRQVESDMAAQAADAWRSADARRGLSDHDALLVHADALTRWSERFRMAFDGDDYLDGER